MGSIVEKFVFRIPFQIVFQHCEQVSFPNFPTLLMSTSLPSSYEQTNAQRKKELILRRIHIRPFKRDDVDAIRQLFEGSFPILFPENYYLSLSVQYHSGCRLVTYILDYLDGVPLFALIRFLLNRMSVV